MRHPVGLELYVRNTKPIEYFFYCIGLRKFPKKRPGLSLGTEECNKSYIKKYIKMILCGLIEFLNLDFESHSILYGMFTMLCCLKS